VWQYLDRFNLPDWWEPVLLQTDAKILSAVNKESKNSEPTSKHKSVKDTAA
jgi:hypothetical protein